MESKEMRVQGAFRIDEFFWSGRKACARIKAKLGDWSGYVELRSDDWGRGMGCVENGQRIVEPDAFAVAPGTCAREGAAALAKAMLEAGFGPMLDMSGQVCARVAADVDAVKFEERGCVGRYR